MTSTTPSPDPGTPEVQIIFPRLRFWILWVGFGVISRYYLAKISLVMRLSEWGVLPPPSPEQEEDIEELRNVLREGIDTHREILGRLEDPRFDPRFDTLVGRLKKVGTRVEARVARRREQSEEAEDAADAPAAQGEEPTDSAKKVTIRSYCDTERCWGVLSDDTPIGWMIEASDGAIGWWGYIGDDLVTSAYGVTFGEAVAAILEASGYDPDEYLV